MLRNERKAKDETAAESSHSSGVAASTASDKSENIKRKLIMKTIEDIKRSLEDQSLELNELHDSDN